MLSDCVSIVMTSSCTTHHDLRLLHLVAQHLADGPQLPGIQDAILVDVKQVEDPLVSLDLLRRQDLIAHLDLMGLVDGRHHGWKHNNDGISGESGMLLNVTEN